MKRHPTPAIADPSEGSHLARLEGLEPPTAQRSLGTRARRPPDRWNHGPPRGV